MMIRTFLLYFGLTVGAYLCQTVFYPALLVSELRVDLFLILVVHASFHHENARTLLLALILGLLMDVGLPLHGFFHPLIYLSVALLGLLLRQNLYLHTRRYQAVFLGLCSLLEVGAMWIILRLHGAAFVDVSLMFRILTCRTVATCLVGPFLLSGLGRLDLWVGSLNNLRESQEA